MSLSQLTKGGIDKSHPKILFHKKWWRPGSKWFYLKSLLNDDDDDDAQRIVRFDVRGMPMKTTGVIAGHFASLFRADCVDSSS